MTVDDFLGVVGPVVPSMEYEQVPFNHPLFIISVSIDNFLTMTLLSRFLFRS